MKHYCITIMMFGILALAFSCEKPAPQPEPVPDPVTPEIKLSAPEDKADFGQITKGDEFSFEWEKCEAISNYKLSLSLNDDMSDSYTVPALQNPFVITAGEFDDVLDELGVPAEGETTVFWSIIPFSQRTEALTFVRSFTVKRVSTHPTGEKLENAATIVHKIGIYYEDMYVGTTGKRLHELCNWENPHSQAQQLAKNMTEASHGVVQYEIAVEIEGTVPYAYYYENSKDGKHKKGDVVTADICYNEFYGHGYPGIGEGVCYDYSKMITDNGFDDMMNDKTIDEVWVYNHPGAGMYETCMAGPNAFWINGSTFSVPSLTRQCTVLFCNYERTVDLAMHSLAHKFENVMKKVYGSWEYGVSLERKLNNWERFSAFNYKYDKYDSGCSHIGNCHCPCNSTKSTDDYNYSSYIYVKSYCDAWDYYPNLVFDDTTRRTINCSEWNGSQLGYMKWFYGHVPHFAGVNTVDQNDYHLNNWWYYFIDYTAAKAYEQKLLREIF